jgi:hypothetical protein
VLLVGTGLALFRHRQITRLTEKDSILIIGVSNRTGDPVFDRTSKVRRQSQFVCVHHLELFGQAIGCACP